MWNHIDGLFTSFTGALLTLLAQIAACKAVPPRNHPQQCGSVRWEALPGPYQQLCAVLPALHSCSRESCQRVDFLLRKALKMSPTSKFEGVCGAIGFTDGCELDCSACALRGRRGVHWQCVSGQRCLGKRSDLSCATLRRITSALFCLRKCCLTLLGDVRWMI